MISGNLQTKTTNKTNSHLNKSASLKASNKLTKVELYDHNEQEITYKYFDPSYDRIQDWLDVLNSIPDNYYSVLGWAYEYTAEDWY